MSDLVKWTRDLEADHNGDGWPAVRMQYLTAMADRIEALEAAVENLLKVKGRYHTEQAFKKLEEVFKTLDKS